MVLRLKPTINELMRSWAFESLSNQYQKLEFRGLMLQPVCLSRLFALREVAGAVSSIVDALRRWKIVACFMGRTP